MSQVDTLHRAARALLQRPLLRAAEQEAFRLVRSHLAELRSWFDANTGWRLHADSEVIRLHKEPALTDDATRPVRDPRNRNAFGRRRYVLFCLALAALERADAQIPLGRLAEQVLLLARGPAMADAGVEFTLSGRDQKADLVAVVHLLLHWGVLARVAGDEEDYLRGTGDVLYDVSRRVLAQLLVARRGPSTITAESLDARIAALGAVEALESDEATNRRIRHRLTRRLLDDPVLYFDELDDADAEYLRRQRPAIVRRIGELTGLVAEVRAEGIAMVDPEDDLSDVKLPETGTEGHLTLLLAEHLARTNAAEHHVEELQRVTRKLAVRHRTYWRKGANEPGAEVALTDASLGRLTALRLVERRGDHVRALPALARFAVAEPVFAKPPASAATPLFEGHDDA
ncbi:MAG: TIGR02678 family protein [Trueperaceae bacterium]|nr:MAG: TIGR02678 family protein [Trueperaceae bacterium]